MNSSTTFGFTLPHGVAQHALPGASQTVRRVYIRHVSCAAPRRSVNPHEVLELMITPFHKGHLCDVALDFDGGEEELVPRVDLVAPCEACVHVAAGGRPRKPGSWPAGVLALLQWRAWGRAAGSRGGSTFFHDVLRPISNACMFVLVEPVRHCTSTGESMLVVQETLPLKVDRDRLPWSLILQIYPELQLRTHLV